MKVCARCKHRKKNSEFVKNRSRPGGLGIYCNPCNNINSKKVPKEQRVSTARKSLLKRYYGLTEEQYEELLSKQSGCCAVCKRHHSEFKKRLSVDHDHNDFSIRGVLCDYCNRFVIGRLRAGNGGIELLQHASEYLKGPYSGWFTPGNIKKKRRKRKK